MLITTRKLQPTDHRGERVKATGPDGRTATEPWDYALDTAAMHRKVAARLAPAGATLTQAGHTARGYTFDAR